MPSFIRALLGTIGFLIFHQCLSQEKTDQTRYHFSLGGSTGAIVPVPFENIPEENDATLLIRPIFGIGAIRPFKGKWHIRGVLSCRVKAVKFTAYVIDQPYSGYILQEVNVNGTKQLSEGNVHDAYFTGDTRGEFTLTYVQADMSILRKLWNSNSLELGFYAGYNASAKNLVDIEGKVSLGPKRPPISTLFSRQLDYANDIRRMDFGLNLGFEQRIYQNVNFTLGFSSGLVSVYQKDFEPVQFAMLNMFSYFGLNWYMNGNFLDFVR